MALAPNKKQRSKVATQKMALRDSLWPRAAARGLWNFNDSDGWLNVPRALPIILRIMDNMSKGKPLSAVYLDLWCRNFNDSFVIANKPREMAFFSGFAGERAERTWMGRIRILEALGFIDIEGGPSGAISYILLLNPYHVLRDAHAKGLVDQSSWNALMEKIIEIRAKDLDPEEPEATPAATEMTEEQIEAAFEGVASAPAPSAEPLAGAVVEKSR